MTQAPATPDTLLDEFVTANKILSDHGLVDGYGHMSYRDNRDLTRYHMPKALPPNFVTADDVLTFDLDSKPVTGIGQKYHGERYIHGEIYKVRPDVSAPSHRRPVSRRRRRRLRSCRRRRGIRAPSSTAWPERSSSSTW